MSLKQDVREQLQAHMRFKRLSQSEVARRSGVSRATVRRALQQPVTLLTAMALSIGVVKRPEVDSVEH